MKIMKKLRLTKKQTNKKDELKLYLSIKESAEYTGLSIFAIRKLVNEESIPFLWVGAKIMIDRIALEKYLKDLSSKHLDLYGN